VLLGDSGEQFDRPASDGEALADVHSSASAKRSPLRATPGIANAIAPAAAPTTTTSPRAPTTTAPAAEIENRESDDEAEESAARKINL
jgi:hypothetical protein